MKKLILESGAVRLAESDACENQAFPLNRNIIGLQFHLETIVESASALLDNCADELVHGPFIQNAKDFQSVPASYYQSIHSIMNDVLSYIVKKS